jgi:long-chain fatty acid transport protein
VDRSYKTAGIAAIIALAALASTAKAGGFNLGEADTDVLFEDGKAVVRAGVTYVSPQRTFDTILGASASDSAYSDDYFIPSLAIKAGISDNFACAFTYIQPFGAAATYGDQAKFAEAAMTGNYTRSKLFTSNEYGATCDAKFDIGPGKIHLLGGLFLQDFDYTEDTLYGTLRLKDDAALGYRLGLAYDIPDYAMRAQLLYRSKIEHTVDGDFTPDALAAVVGADPLNAYGAGALPQSVKLSLQSGVAPGWLVYGSVMWTDWSVLDSFDYTIDLLGPQKDIYNWKDGWTVQAGLGHSFTDDIAGTVNLTWDKGVGTGADIQADTWTLGVGASANAGPGQFVLGAGVSYLTSGSQSVADGADYDATANGDWAYAVTGSYKISF